MADDVETKLAEELTTKLTMPVDFGTRTRSFISSEHVTGEQGRAIANTVVQSINPFSQEIINSLRIPERVSASFQSAQQKSSEEQTKASCITASTTTDFLTLPTESTKVDASAISHVSDDIYQNELTKLLLQKFPESKLERIKETLATHKAEVDDLADKGGDHDVAKTDVSTKLGETLDRINSADKNHDGVTIGELAEALTELKDAPDSAKNFRAGSPSVKTPEFKVYLGRD